MQQESEKLADGFARAELQLPVKGEEKDGLIDFGWNYPTWYTWPLFIRWYRSELTALPDVGGYADQDEQLMQDLYQWHALVMFHMRKYRRGAKEKPPVSADLASQF